jgi:NADH:ubiquinone oxidoreductase subunit E
MGGDAIFSALKEHLGIENDGVTEMGKFLSNISSATQHVITHL